MDDEVLGWIRLLRWPIVLLLVTVFFIDAVQSGNREDARRDTNVACLKSGGDVGEHNGWPTCQHPK